MLLPRRGLNIFAKSINTSKEEEIVVSMVDEQLRNHLTSAVQTAAVAVFKSAADKIWER